MVISIKAQIERDGFILPDEADCNEDAAYSGATKLSLATLNGASL